MAISARVVALITLSSFSIGWYLFAAQLPSSSSSAEYDPITSITTTQHDTAPSSLENFRSPEFAQILPQKERHREQHAELPATDAPTSVAPTFAPVATREVDRLTRLLDEAGTQAGTNCDATEQHIVSVAMELSLASPSGYRISRGEDVYRHYPAMVLFIDAIRHAFTAYPQHERCWHHWWFTFQRRVKDTVIARMHQFGGSNTDGQLYLAAGFGEYVTRHSKGQHWRHGWFPQDFITHAAKKVCVNFTMYFISYYDEDIYLITRNDIHRRTQLRNFLNDFPNFFFFHYSPAMVMPDGVGASLLGDRDPFYPDRGAKKLYYTMFPRMIPVPHSPTDGETINRIMAQSWPPKPYGARQHQVAWRGSTTGHERPYSRSDRSRVVAQFSASDHASSKYSWADVAFSGVCQGVTQRELPRYGNRMNVEQLMHYQVHLDIDGNSNSWDGLRWRLMFGMVVVKARSSNGFTQWYYRHLQNGVNIIEARVDDVATEARAILDDVDRGTKIAAQAKAFGDKYLTFPAMEQAVLEAVRDAWRLGYDDQMKWCVSPC
ncbi:membrane-associated protein, putative [Bodo saltans]|uniref:Membrane-associated protein, putative n=1 Tax=Bodo saltans TaxID=75058 RepID=A0A0S4JSS1_BODSA|nr:membrane-associated protein, putative [Bodo saltans]|eukprot:CUG93283.1 membrane-associated protein, putative [Bodo saltans]